jgi:hypothetical protein
MAKTQTKRPGMCANRLRIIVSVLVFLAHAPLATADRVEITYDITSGQIPGDVSAMITGGSLTLSYDVTVTGGGPSLSVCQATPVLPSYVINEGATLLLAISLEFNAQYAGYGAWSTNGQVAAPTGPVLTPACTFNGVQKLYGATPAFSLPGSQVVTCISPASYCTYTGYPPGVPQTFPATANVDPGGFAWNRANGTGSAVGSFGFSTVSGGRYTYQSAITFVGQEILAAKRFVVPEPGTGWLGATSLATLAVLARARRPRPLVGQPSHDA